jgi:hypothetical protein
MNKLEEQPEQSRHYSIDNYRASAPERTWIEPTPSPLELKQRHDAVMARLHKEARRGRLMHRVLYSGYAVTGISYWLGLALLNTVSHSRPVALDVLFLLSVAAQLGFMCARYFWSQSIKEMAASADVRDIGAFIEAVDVDSAASHPALSRLLPKLSAGNCGLLQEQHCDILRKFAGSRVVRISRVPLVIAILKAYEQVGDEEDIPVVEKLAAGAGYGKYRQVRLVAEECLPALRIIATQHRAQLTLLRASSLQDANPADLVRAAAIVDAGPDEMLRAVSMKAVQL